MNYPTDPKAAPAGRQSAAAGGTASARSTRGSVGSALFNILDVADQIHERVSGALSQVDLSYPKYELLKHLAEAEEPVSLGALAEGQSCARSNITQLIDRLESDGLVRRVADPDDRRSIRAELTPLGAAKAEDGKRQMERVVAEFESALTDRERLEFVRLLMKLG